MTMYKEVDLVNMSDVQLCSLLVKEHAYLAEDVAEYDRDFLMEIVDL